MYWTITNARLVLPDGIRPGGIVIQDGKIAQAGPDISPAGRVLDAGGRLVLPGLVDIHCHGGDGHDVLENSMETLRTVGSAHARFGTTSWLPTTWSAPLEKLLEAVRCVRDAMGRSDLGPEVLGIHFEGPFLNAEQKGAHDPAFLCDPRAEIYEPLLLAARLPQGGCAIRHWTVAPELPGVPAFIRRAKAENISIAIGHSMATYEDVAEAALAGANHVTHLYNAMQGIHRGPLAPGQGNGRLPGVVGAALDLEALTVEVICDHVHVHPGLVRVAIRCKGMSKVLLVSDAMSAMGTSGASRHIAGGAGTLAAEPGKLASSPFPLLHMVRTMNQKVGVPLHQAVQMATVNPARIIGEEGRKGVLAPGFDADFFMMDDGWNVQATWSGGTKIYSGSDL